MPVWWGLRRPEEHELVTILRDIRTAGQGWTSSELRTTIQVIYDWSVSIEEIERLIRKYDLDVPRLPVENERPPMYSLQGPFPLALPSAEAAPPDPVIFVPIETQMPRRGTQRIVYKVTVDRILPGARLLIGNEYAYAIRPAAANRLARWNVSFIHFQPIIPRSSAYVLL